MTPVLAVAVIDSGLNPQAFPDGTVLPGVNLSGDGADDDTNDPLGHGTAVGTTVLGLAPAVRLVPVRLMNRYGFVFSPAALTAAAFVWIAAHRQRLGIGLICAAVADDGRLLDDAAHRDSETRRVIAALAAQGVPTVAAAGNRAGDDRAPGMAWPAILREVVSVGALDARSPQPALDPGSRRLAAVGGCATTVFARPGPPGQTSGATAVVAGVTAARGPSRWPLPVTQYRDADGLVWPVLSPETGQAG